MGWNETFFAARVPPPARGKTVLIVEDDPQLRELYKTTLTMAGFVVVAVADGLDALRRIDAGEPLPSAVVLDMELPRLHGRDVQRELAAHVNTRQIPIVVVSGTDTRGLNPNDFACVLRKPIEPEQLVKAIDDCVRGVGPGNQWAARVKHFVSRKMRRRATDEQGD
jgi:DNA-binding response OmpR family regulator